MNLKQILQNQNKHIDKLLLTFDKSFNSLSYDVRKEILYLFRTSDLDLSVIINQAFESSKYFNEISNFAKHNVEMIQYTKQIANELGYKFALTQGNIELYEQFQNTIFTKLSKNIELYQAEMNGFMIRSQLEGKSINQISSGLGEVFGGMGRRLNTEINTSISISDSMIKKDFYKQAGIDKFVYAGPDDDKTRDTCSSTLNDPRQEMGWTLEEVNNSETPFVERGGFNCRHQWMAFV